MDTDMLTFNPGTYKVKGSGGGSYLIGGEMTVSGFEDFGAGANHTDFLVAAAAGSVTFT
jgi:hypothetical protein